MPVLPEFHAIMANQSEIALATSMNNSANVRIMNFYHDPENNGLIYITTLRDSQKVNEFALNDQLSFTTIPKNDLKFVRAVNATVRQSDKSIWDMQDAFVNKIPSYAHIIELCKDALAVYEIHFKQATITVGFETKNITF